MRITVEGVSAEPLVFENVRGSVMLMRTEEGVRKAVLGPIRMMEMVLMLKTLTSGEGEVNKKIRMAMQMANALELDDLKVRDETPLVNGLNDPFSELLGGK